MLSDCKNNPNAAGCSQIIINSCSGENTYQPYCVNVYDRDPTINLVNRAEYCKKHARPGDPHCQTLCQRLIDGDFEDSEKEVNVKEACFDLYKRDCSKLENVDSEYCRILRDDEWWWFKDKPLAGGNSPDLDELMNDYCIYYPETELCSCIYSDLPRFLIPECTERKCRRHGYKEHWYKNDCPPSCLQYMNLSGNDLIAFDLNQNMECSGDSPFQSVDDARAEYNAKVRNNENTNGSVGGGSGTGEGSGGSGPVGGGSSGGPGSNPVGGPGSNPVGGPGSNPVGGGSSDPGSNPVGDEDNNTGGDSKFSSRNEDDEDDEDDEEDTDEKSGKEKKIYEKWWFWVIIGVSGFLIIIIIIIAAASSGNSSGGGIDGGYNDIYNSSSPVGDSCYTV